MANRNDDRYLIGNQKKGQPLVAKHAIGEVRAQLLAEQFTQLWEAKGRADQAVQDWYEALTAPEQAYVQAAVALAKELAQRAGPGEAN